MVARDEQKRTRGRAAWGDMVDSAVADMVAWDDALGVMMWVTATSRRKEGLTGTDWRRKAQERERRGLAETGRRARERGETKRRQPERTEDGGARRTETDEGPGGLGRHGRRRRRGHGGLGRCAWRDDVCNGNEPSQREAGGNWQAGAGRGLGEPEKRPTKLAGPG